MTELDAQKEYAEIRAEHGMAPHDEYNPRDLTLLDFFLAGVVRGIRHTPESIKEKG